jgi:hypothetical protein
VSNLILGYVRHWRLPVCFEFKNFYTEMQYGDFKEQHPEILYAWNETNNFSLFRKS